MRKTLLTLTVLALAVAFGAGISAATAAPSPHAVAAMDDFSDLVPPTAPLMTPLDDGLFDVGTGFGKICVQLCFSCFTDADCYRFGFYWGPCKPIICPL